MEIEGFFCFLEEEEDEDEEEEEGVGFWLTSVALGRFAEWLTFSASLRFGFPPNFPPAALASRMISSRIMRLE